MNFKYKHRSDAVVFKYYLEKHVWLNYLKANQHYLFEPTKKNSLCEVQKLKSKLGSDEKLQQNKI